MAQDSDSGGKITIDDGDLAIFFGQNAQYYLTEKAVMERSGSRVSWNWPAFLFNVVWMYYWKLWAPATVSAIAIIMFNASIIFLEMAVVLVLLLGMYGNYIYLDHAKMKVVEIGLGGGAPEQHRDTLHRSGGTSWPAAIISFLVVTTTTIVLLILWSGMIFAFFGGLYLWLIRELHILG